MSHAARRAAHRAGAPVPAAALAEGLVTAGYRRHFAVHLDDGSDLECLLRGRHLSLACGDRVHVAPTADGGVIHDVLPRSSLFYRSDTFKQKLIAANVTQVVGVVAPDVGVDEELIHRWIVAAEAQRCRIVLAANKADLPGFDALLARLAPIARLGYTVIALSARRDIAPLLPWLQGQRSVLIGQSGMGKSTLLNAVAPAARARTAEVSGALAAGRHTTSHSALHLLPPPLGDGWIIDSPGMKVFGMAHLAPNAIAEAFVEMGAFIGRCRFRDCRHGAEPGCALQAAVERGEVAAFRLALMRSMTTESHAARAPGR